MAIAEHIERATQLIAAGDYREAIRTCRRALLAHPESIKVRLLLGSGLLAVARYEEVRTEMFAVLRSSPREVAAYRFLGEAFLYDGRPDRALEAFEKALEIDPSSEDIQALLDDAAFEEPTATAEQVIPGAAEITRESVLPKFEEEHTEPTQRALPKAVFRERQRATARGTQSYSMPPGSLPPPGRLPSPSGRLPSGIAGMRQEAKQGEAVRSRTSVPPPPPRAALNYRSSAPPPSRVSSTVPPPPPRKVPSGPEKPVYQKTLLGSPSPSGKPAPRDDAGRDDASRGHANIVLEQFDAESEDTKDTWNTADALLSGELDAMERGLSDRLDSSDFEDLPTEVQPPPTSLRASPPVMASEPTVAEGLDDEAFDVDEETRDGDPLWGTPSSRPVPPPSLSPPVDHRQRVRRSAGRNAATKRWVLGGVSLLLLFGLGFGITAWWRLSSREAELREAVLAVTRHGGAAQYERALGLARRQDEPVLAGRLMAARAYEHGGTDPAKVRESLKGLDDNQSNYVLSLGYLALLEGQPEEVLRLLSAQTTDAEAQYIMSRAQLELGNWDEARKNARSAAQLVPGAARYEAQRVVTEAVTGVGGTPPAEMSEHLPLQVASQIHDYMTGKGVSVDRVQQLLGQELTVADQAWLRWLMLRAAIDDDRKKPAKKMAEELTSEDALRALRHAPSPLRLLIATAMLDIAQPHKAATLFSTLSPGVRARPEALAPQVHLLLMRDMAADARALLKTTNEKTPAVHLLTARVELAEGKYKAALSALEGAMHDQRTRTEAMTLAAESYRALGKWRDAIRMIEPVWKVRRSHAVTTRALIASLLEAGETDRALGVIDEFEKAGGDATITALTRARIALDDGDLEAAKAVGAKLKPGTVEATVIKAQILRRTGDLETAHALLSKGLVEAPRHQAMLQEMVLLSLRRYAFDQARKSLKLLDLTNTRSKSIAAMVEITNAGGADALENVEDLSNSTDADLHVYRAYGLYHAENDAEAGRAFERTLKLRPGHPEALVGEALVALRRGAVASADSAAEAALKAADQVGTKFQARAIAVQAKLNYERGAFSQAEELVARALRFDSDSSLAHLVSASLAEERGGNATPAFKKASEGNFVMPEALARYALSSKKPHCDMAKRYLQAAPNGYDAPDMRRIVSRCE